MSEYTILLVEDEPHLSRVIKDSLEQLGYGVKHAADGAAAWQLFLDHRFDCCIVDVMLPNIDGYTLVRQIRTRRQQLPVLFLTARTATADLVEGYDSGGNDYLKKPFSLEELFLRVKELLKRNAGPRQPEAAGIIGRYTFIPHKQLLQLAGQPDIRLSYREAQLLQMLYQQKNALLDRKQALLALWGDDNFFNTRTMDVFITKLRKHLAHDPAIRIVNVRGIGYKLIC